MNFFVFIPRVPIVATDKPFRFNMPEIGYTYDSLRDGFIPPKPGNDYILIEKKLQWTSMMNWTSEYKEQVKCWRDDI